jgi:tRNA (mo5U34)-methyltransferase
LPPDRDPTTSRPGLAREPGIDDVPLWYHTLELPDGRVTPGWFDHRAIVERLPWPDVRDKRCLDVGTYDGFWAFELERRGAREVVATDIGAHTDWDFLERMRTRSGETLERLAGQKGLGFEVARRALGSAVHKRIISVYDLSPGEVGTFDFVMCGSLLLHLRDPVGALEAIASVCSGSFMSIEEVSLGLSLRFRHRAVAELRLEPKLGQWAVPNMAGHIRMLEAAGLQVIERAGPFSEPFGVGHPPRGTGVRERARRLTRRVLTGNDGVPHAAALTVVAP